MGSATLLSGRRLPTSNVGILGCVKDGWIRQLEGTLNG
jgi:hypothetical protein